MQRETFVFAVSTLLEILQQPGYLRVAVAHCHVFQPFLRFYRVYPAPHRGPHGPQVSTLLEILLTAQCDGFTATYAVFQPFLRFCATPLPPEPAHCPHGDVSTLLEILPAIQEMRHGGVVVTTFQPFLRFYCRSAAECAEELLRVSTLLEILRGTRWRCSSPQRLWPCFNPS